MKPTVCVRSATERNRRKLVSTRDRLVQIVTAEPGKYYEAELGRVLGGEEAEGAHHRGEGGGSSLD